MARAAAAAAVFAAALAFVAHAGATTYYVSPTGNDSAAGTSAVPWQTVGRVNNATLQPGDTVLFQGGATFSQTLMPAQSGTAAAPITFGSYGSGQANVAGGIWFSQKSYLTFDGLEVDSGNANGTLSAIQASASGSGSVGIVIRNCTLTHDAIGINSANAGDGGWTISNDLIQYTGDSGSIVLGHDFRWTGNTILDTGTNSSITYGKHGVYAKGPGQVFVGNTIRRFSADGLSLRYRNATVEGNTISDGPIGIAWFQQDASAGTTTIAYNKITNTTSSGIYVSPSDDAGNTRESFVIANNTVVGSSGNATDLNATSGSLTLANNAFGGSVTVSAHIVPPAGTFSEHNDDFSTTSGPASLAYNGGSYTLAGYRSASGQGAADLSGAPGLAADLSPNAGAQVIDAGSTGVGGIAYTAGCDGALFHYCGNAPDIGAVESGASAPLPVSSLAAPTGLASTSTATSITLSWTAAADPRVVSYSVTRDSGAAVATTSTSFTVSGLSCGTSSTFAVRSVGADGSTSSPVTLAASTSLCASPPPPPAPPTDTTPPYVLITSPANGATVGTTTTVYVTATDASGIADVTFWVDGTQTCVVKSAPYTCTVSLAANKSHTLLVRARDGAGNVGWMSVKVTASKSRRYNTAVAPATGTSVASHFVLAYRTPPTGTKQVVFAVDGHTVCTDRRAPFSCSTSARPGWHRAVLRVTGAKRTTVTTRFRVR